MTDINEKTVTLIQLGLTEAFKKNFDDAVKYIEKVQKLFLERKDVYNIAICLAELALIHYQNNSDRLIRSLTLLNDAKAILDNQPQNAEVEAKILHYYGTIYYSEKRYSEALKYFRNALELVNNNNLEYAKILDSLAIFYLRINNHQVAEKYLKEALKCKQKIGNELEITITKLLYGRYLSNIENYDEALLYLSEALKFIEGLGDNSTAARIQDELAKIYLEIGNIEAAEELCKKSMDLAKRTDAPLVYAFSCCTLANIKIKQEKPKEALQILENEVKPASFDLTSIRGYALAKRIKAMAFNQLGQIQEAIVNLHESVELFKEAGVNAEAARSYFELAETYKNEDHKAAFANLIEAFKIAKSNNLTILAKKIEDFIYEIDQTEWANIVNKAAFKEKLTNDSESILNALNLIDPSKVSTNPRDPLISLLKIGRSIAAETDIDKLLEIIAEETKATLNADRCTVFLLDRETNELWSKVALGMGQQEIRFPAHMGLAGHVATTGKTINIKDAYNDDRFNKEIDKKTGYTTKTILCMPMRNLNQEIVGVFQVLNKLGGATFSDEDEDLLIAIGSSAGIALENARLFQKQLLMYEDQKRSFISFINTLAAAIDARDKITSGHSTRVTGYSVAIAKQMEIPQEKIEVLEIAALLHDFGKIGIKDSVLCKEGKLTDEEYKHIQEHAYITNEILKNMYFEEKYKNVPEIASSHHEKYNGMGYFRKTKGEEIPLGGRILAVADVFDAITSKRHYRDRMPFLQVLSILKKDSGSHFDGGIVDEFFNIRVNNILDVLLLKTDAASLTDEEEKLFEKYTINDMHQILQKEESDRTEIEKEIITTFEKHYNPPHENKENA
ncbi:MAG: hypothetical protein A2287_04330 [Candidatus Melainabacteria bacterium RIFOXYA12_FULL_32_12]|nr:MAG: hypothetical protein A2255_03665 [Candidatus Melainabacteria bacterium RIFOXYA2_FULL_32_9]OGI27229.1 MAG: hypothetical protein A2287_04330 [Candidatus Melainabacteria bacterium RIFOXYA12_FULL_32_12]